RDQMTGKTYNTKKRKDDTHERARQRNDINDLCELCGLCVVRPEGLMTRSCRIIFGGIAYALGLAAIAAAQDQPVTIRAARVIDGKGKTLQNATVEVRGSKIVKLDQRSGPVTYDLGNRTVLPRMIDVHVHIGGHFKN